MEDEPNRTLERVWTADLLRSEFGTTHRPPTRPEAQAGRVGAAGRGSATCGRRVTLDNLLSLL